MFNSGNGTIVRFTLRRKYVQLCDDDDQLLSGFGRLLAAVDACLEDGAENSGPENERPENRGP